jgi:uncharacterized tellurite resistance protein B-like protein
MGLWNFFKSVKEEKKELSSRLQSKLEKIVPNYPEDELIKLTCIAGLLARVAFIDMEIDEGEVIAMKKAITDWTDLGQDEIDAIVTIALDEIKELSGIENHKYCHPLNNYFSNEQKLNVLKMLFAIAAGDDTVSEVEGEEIRLISKGLLLEHSHFVMAKSTVFEKLGAFKADNNLK